MLLLRLSRYLRFLCVVGGGKAWGGAKLALGLPWTRVTCILSTCPLLPPQGVIEFSLCLLFAKLVSYTFLYWLPLYIFNVGKLLGRRGGAGSLRGEETCHVIPGYRQDFCGTAPRAKGGFVF